MSLNLIALFQVALAWGLYSQAAGQSTGAPECPCITNVSVHWAALQADLAAAGRPAQYGMGGCRAYDENSTLEGCAQNEHSYCLNPWCYVDTTLCPLNTASCEAAGGTVGGDASPYCRSRPSSLSVVLNSTLHYYSYQTCGSVNAYDNTALSEPIAGVIVRTAVDAWAPWVLLKDAPNGGQEYGGALYDFFMRSIPAFDPLPVMQLIPGWATPESRAKFSSSYTACVHDVAVGNFDICIADLWLTPERAQLAQFTPSLRSDLFYLLVPKLIQEDTLATRMRKPFAPFSVGAWGMIIGFMVGMSLLLGLMELLVAGPDAFRGVGRMTACKDCGGLLCRSLYTMWHDFLTGGSTDDGHHGCERQFFRLGFAFFVLVIMASYTASLASMLVVQRQAIGTIANIDDAVAKSVTICTSGVLMPSLTRLYPKSSLIDVGYMENAMRKMYAGECGAAVVSQDIINKVHAGMIKEADCKAVADGTMTADEAHCEKGFNGKARNDCDVMRVGDIILTIPVAFPISDRLAHSVSWAVMKQKALGVMEEVTKLNEGAYPVSQCEVLEEEEESEEDGLEVGDLAGTVVIATLVVGVGALCLAGKAIAMAWKMRAPSDSRAGEPKQSAEGGEEAYAAA
mmetsp:Transcript_114680/g.370567  ORF Transcript_114680/g.370567 Transcript_114680/m.370567 type:complete len:625 (-) Transcript_114680:272-2146(-)